MARRKRGRGFGALSLNNPAVKVGAVGLLAFLGWRMLAGGGGVTSTDVGLTPSPNGTRTPLTPSSPKSGTVIKFHPVKLA